MWPLISGQNTTSPRVNIPLSHNTLISGEYKILVGKVPKAGWTGPQNSNNTKPQGAINASENCTDRCIYNIKVDPLVNENDNLATKMPNVLKSKLQMYQKG